MSLLLHAFVMVRRTKAQVLLHHSDDRVRLRALRKDGQIQKVSLGMNSHRQHNAPHRDAWTPEVITDFIEAAPPCTFDSALLAYVSHR